MDSVSEFLSASAARLKCDQNWEAVTSALEMDNSKLRALVSNLAHDLANAQAQFDETGFMWIDYANSLKNKHDSLVKNVKIVEYS